MEYNKAPLICDNYAIDSNGLYLKRQAMSDVGYEWLQIPTDLLAAIGNGFCEKCIQMLKEGTAIIEVLEYLDFEASKMCERKTIKKRIRNARVAVMSVVNSVSLHIQRARTRAYHSPSRRKTTRSKTASSSDSGDPDPGDPPAWQFSSHNPHELTPKTTQQNRYFSLRCFSPCCCRMSGGMLI